MSGMFLSVYLLASLGLHHFWAPLQLLCERPWPQRPSRCRAQAPGCKASTAAAGGFRRCSSVSLQPRLHGRGERAQLLRGVWDCPRPGTKTLVLCTGRRTPLLSRQGSPRHVTLQPAVCEVSSIIAFPHWTVPFIFTNIILIFWYYNFYTILYIFSNSMFIVSVFLQNFHLIINNSSDGLHAMKHLLYARHHLKVLNELRYMLLRAV